MVANTLKVLIVDDDRDVALLFKQMFRKEVLTNQYELVFKFSTEEALAYLAEKGFTDLVLILSDINMPGRNGLELLQEIKNSESKTPVFLFTAYDEENNRVLSEKYKADKYIAKPIDFDVLKADIQSLINAKKSINSNH